MKDLLNIFGAVLVILVTVVLMDVIAETCYNYVKGNTIYSKTEYSLSLTDSCDLVFVGSSRANHHYNTVFLSDSLGINSLNLGMDGRGLTYSYPIVASFLKKNRPKTVVLEVLPQELEGVFNDRLNILYPYVNEEPAIMEIASKMDSNNKLFLKSFFYRHNSIILNEAKEFLNPYNPVSKGYTPLSPKKNNKLKEEIVPGYGSIDSISLYCLNRIYDICNEKNVRLIVAISPEYFKRDEPVDLINFCNKRDIVFIDNREFRLNLPPERYFNDNSHLNELGALEYTKHFIRQLSEY